MAEFFYDLHPVSHLTTDAVGMPGQRVFYLQAQQNDQLVTLIAEKEQIRALSESITQILTELASQGIPLPPQSEEPTPTEMLLREPIDPLFRIAQMGLGYDTDEDLLVLVVQELIMEEEEEEEQDDLFASSEPAPQPEREPRIVRFWASRALMQALSRQGQRAVTSGRPLCPQCLQPMDPTGHFCAKKNGHAGLAHS